MKPEVKMFEELEISKQNSPIEHLAPDTKVNNENEVQSEDIYKLKLPFEIQK